MPKMTAMEAAVHILRSEGVETVFGIPGAAILPLYDALRGSGINHVLARHEEGASHMAEGYNRASGKIGVCLGTSGPAGTDMVTGLYSAQADSIPILVVTGQAPRAELHREYFQAVDIAAITKPVTKWSVTVMEAAQIPGVFRQAFQIMQSGRPGPVHIDLPIDIQKEMIEYDPEVDHPLEVFKPVPQRKQIEKALQMMMGAERPVIVAGGGVALLRCMDALDKLDVTGEEKSGVVILKRALQEPLRQIVGNAGLEGSVVVNKVLEGKGDYGFNAATETYENLLAAGVIDPTKVVRFALQNAASVTGLMLTTEAMITDKPEKKKGSAAPPMGDDMY